MTDDPFDPNLPYMQKMLTLFESLTASGVPLPPGFEQKWATIKPHLVARVERGPSYTLSEAEMPPSEKSN